MAHQAFDYHERVAEELDKAAYGLFSVTIRPRSESNAVLLSFEGTCPACFGRMTYDYPLVAEMKGVPPDRDSLDRLAEEHGLASGDIDALLFCACGPEHKNHPAGDAGCGARFKINVKWGETVMTVVFGRATPSNHVG